MIDREYFKLNTSINTASNAKTLHYDENGNVEASLELRLPENIFSGNTPTRTVQSLDMLTTKFRLSMQNTPIAQIPEDTALSTETERIYSTCQLDVYPFSYLADGSLAPRYNGEAQVWDDTYAFQDTYKDKTATVKIFYYTMPTEVPELIHTVSFPMNSGNLVIQSDPFFDFLRDSGVLNQAKHILNMSCKKNHGEIQVNDGHIFISSIGVLEQMFQDALENAITCAASSEKITVNVNICTLDNAGNFTNPTPKTQYTVEYDGNTFCYWSSALDEHESSINSSLQFGCKPKVEFTGQSLKISYDTSAFGKNMIPILWNTPYVKTWSFPQPLLDLFPRINKNWLLPPPKRQYAYSVTPSATSFDFGLLDDLDCAPLNIIGNRSMKNAFPFLPWIPVNLKKMPGLTSSTKKEFEVRVTDVPISQRERYQHQVVLGETTNMTSARWTGVGVGEGHTAPNPVAVPYSETPVDIPTSLFPATGYDYLVYTYTIAKGVQNIPENRISQLLQYGENVNPAGSFIMNANSSLGSYITPWQNQPDLPPEEIVSDTFVYDNPYLTPGTIILNTRTDSSTDTPTTTTSSEMIVSWYFSSTNGSPCYINVGEWDPLATEMWMKAFPKSAAMRDLVIAQNDEYETHAMCWNFSMGYTPNLVYSSENKSVDDTTTKSMQTTIETREETIFIKDLTDQTALIKCTPNLDLVDNTFYILDGTTMTVTIDSPEVVEISDHFTYTENVTTVTTTSEAPVQKLTRGETPDHPAISRKYLGISRYRTRDDTILPDNVLIFEYHMPEAEYALLPVSARHDPDKITVSYASWGTILDENRPGAPTVIAENVGEYTEINSETTTRTEGTDSDYPPVGTTVDTTEDTNDVLVSGQQIGIATSSDLMYTKRGMVTETLDMKQYTYPNRGPGVSENIWLPKDWWEHPHGLKTFTTNAGTVRYFVYYWQLDQNADYNYVREYEANYAGVYTRRKTETTVTTVKTVRSEGAKIGNVRLSFTWDNLPVVVMSPIQSIVLTMTGVQISHETQPINIPDAANPAASLTAVVPIVENYYSLATTLRDLHDELVVAKESFDDNATYKMGATAGNERVLHFSAKYITKDGSLHQIYIPPNGVFSLQVTFRLDYYIG